MRGCWLIRTGKPSCLLFMAGWGMGPQPFTGMFPDGPDIFLCYDYTSLALPDLSWMREYETMHLLAWSMGVFVAARTLAGLENHFQTRTALAGTLHPIHDLLGIPQAAWMAMERGLDRDRLERFHASMFEEEKERQRFLAHPPARSTASLAGELTALRGHAAAAPPPEDIFTRRIITRRDRIFPPRNQVRAWRGKNSIRQPWPHFPFTDRNLPLLLSPIGTHAPSC